MYRKNRSRSRRRILPLALLLFTLLPCGALAQTEVTGAIAGVVTDPSGAVVPNMAVTVINTKTGDRRSVRTTADGRYVVPFLPPSVYTVSASGTGLTTGTLTTTVILGHQTEEDLVATPMGTKQIVQVSASAPQLIDTQSANLTTTFSQKQMELLPNPGGDITTIAYTAPSVVVNRGGSSGEFSSQGMPASSNLFVLNGFDVSSAWNNNNMSGASNNTIGQSQIAEAAVVQNGYSAQYGRQAGAIEVFTTKAGSNQFHGESYWLYNSDGLNANDFFNNLSGTPREKAVSNQYGANIGGPIIRNKLFFFTGTEGLRYVLPTEGYINFPSAAFQNTIVNTVSPASAALYQQMFAFLNSSPTAKAAVPVSNGKGPLQDPNNKMGCGTEAGTAVYGESGVYFGTVPAGVAGTAIPCMTTTHATASNLNQEWLFYTRIDWSISDKDQIFGRLTVDHGQQPTYTSFVSPVFNVVSNQPIYTAQINDTYTFSPKIINQFIIGASYISAIFAPANLQTTLATSPTLFYDPDDGGTTEATGIGQGSYYGFRWPSYPQGRNQTMYQVVDDLSWLAGEHNFKFGINFRRADITDYGPEENTYGGEYTFKSLADLASGNLPGTSHSTFVQSFPQFQEVALAMSNVGIYAQDEWQALRNLKMTYGLRVERTDDPTCGSKCFSYYEGGFPGPNVSAATPYDVTIADGRAAAFPGMEVAEFLPRVGIAYDVNGKGTTVIRAGAGLFSDLFPVELTNDVISNFPDVIAPTVETGTVSSSATGSAPAYASASAAAALNGYNQGLNYSQIKSELATDGVPFALPGATDTPSQYRMAKYMEWSLQVQHEFSRSDAVIISYVGNHGYDELIQDLNANQSLSGTKVTSFGGLPATSPDPRFDEVRQFGNDANSSYHGAVLTFRHFDEHGFAADANYTFGHALDDISESGLATAYNSSSITTQLTSSSSSYLMYGSADYDIRHNLSMDMTYQEPNRFGNKLLNKTAAGWTVSAKAFWTSGEPFSVLNSAAGSSISNGTGTDQVLADLLVPSSSISHSCNSYSHPCLQKSGLFNGTAAQSDFGNLERNSFRGPHYADADANLDKNLYTGDRFQFMVGASAYNLSNHPNFANPEDNAALGTQGIIDADVSPPTSPYGAFQGSAVSGRVVVVRGKMTF